MYGGKKQKTKPKVKELFMADSLNTFSEESNMLSLETGLTALCSPAHYQT